MKDEKISPSDRYLGANLELFQTKSGTLAWSMSGREYVKNAVRNLEDTLLKEGHVGLSTRIQTPMDINYRPEIDITPVLSPESITRYQNLIGVLNGQRSWAVLTSYMKFPSYHQTMHNQEKDI